MCAALMPDVHVLILEQNPRLAKKIRVSGGGKCNITNDCLANDCYEGDSEFISTALETFDNRALLTWLKKRGLEPVITPRIAPGQFFCASSEQPIGLLAESASHADIRLNHPVSDVHFGEHFEIKGAHTLFQAQNLVVATGGLSYPQLGVSDIGFKIASQFGHKVRKPAPALVGMSVQKEQFWFKELSGLSLPVCIEIKNREIKGNLLFTHKGCSGPAVMDASLFWEKGVIHIDFLPKLAWEKVPHHSTKQLTTVLPLPKRFVLAFLESLGIKDKPCRRYSESEWKNLKTIKHYTVAPAGVLGYSKAEAMRGGVCTDEIEPESMQSRLQKGLFFTGEVLDVTGRLGGYNFQWAFSSAYVCAGHIQRIKLSRQVCGQAAL